MKKTLAVILCVCMMLALFAGCGESASTQQPAAAQTEAPAEPADENALPEQYDLIMTFGAETGSVYAMGIQIGEYINSIAPDITCTVKVGAAASNLALLSTGETMSRRVAIMQAACEEFGMKFVLETAPDPTSDVGVAGAQAYILEKVPEWVEKYGQKAAYFCTNDAHTEPLLKQLLEYGGYFIEADLPSPTMGYPGALGIDLTAEAGDYAKILAKVEEAICEKGGADRFGTWAFSYGYTVSAGLAQHALNVINGESELCDIDDIAKAYEVFSPGAAWNGSNYTNAETGVKAENTFLVYQDTYIMGNPGHYMGSTSVEVPEKYFTIK